MKLMVSQYVKKRASFGIARFLAIFYKVYS